MMVEKQLTRVAQVRSAELTFSEGILYIRIRPEIELVIADLQEISKASLILTEGKPYCALADARTSPVSSPEVRAFGATQGYSETCLADALLVDSTAMKLTVNFYIAFNKPRIPTRMFTVEAEAILWLKSFLI
ncbi:MAG TPA: hypothetical protein VNZ86_08190 [Bacteroidia bacterium]|jgi:hypothetical protein|nr:hypothetical protein [Bacteroidia bacterium]